MPYKNREERLAAMKAWREKKRQDAEYLKAEARRKAEWLETPMGKASNYLGTKRYRRNKPKE